jgi:ubiquitin carboxyl-terminal hydrolase 34
MWRTLFSIFILRTHLNDFARLGVAEETFLLHGIGLLVELIAEEGRPNYVQEYKSAMDCLIMFLQGAWRRWQQLGCCDADNRAERPKHSTIPVLIDDASRFVNRMIDICFNILDMLAGERSKCLSLLELTMRTLFEAFRRQTSVWTSFKEHPRKLELHRRLLFHEDTAIVTSTTKVIRPFSLDMDSADDVADFYMGMFMGCLADALETPTHWYVFDLTIGAMHANRKLRHDEDQARTILKALINCMWKHQHTESVDHPVPDMAMCGLLKLVREAVVVVRSFKNPLGFDGLSLKIFDKLLFPPLKSSSSRPLVSTEARTTAYQLVQGVCETPEDFEALLEVTKTSLLTANGDPHVRYPGDSEWLRPATKCSGLTNLGMTCYMNSLLQQLYANVHFRRFIFSTELVDGAKQELLDHVQQLFACMQNDYEWTSNTLNLAKILNVQVDSQEDVHGFYEDFLSKLEASMPDDAAKTTLRSFFTGKLISQIKGECGHVSPKTEPFVDLPIIVKNKASLEDSLQEFVQGEPMEGANMYKCMACDAEEGGRLVNAMKRACPEEMPDNLTFCLKRFTFEAMLGIDGKVNDRFEFPQSIDMSRYHRKHLDNPEAKIDKDVFELVGVIVHQGTLNLGHYWSYVLLRNTGAPDRRCWVKLEDRFVSSVEGGVQEVQRECLGGQFYNNGNERADNAYVLFYQRKSSLEEQIALPGPVFDPTSSYLLPPKVAIPERLATEIHHQNEWRHRISQLFDNQLDGFMRFMLTAYRNHRVDTPTQSETGSQDGREPDQAAVMSRPSTSSDHLIKLISETAVVYVQRIAVTDSAGAVKPKACFNLLRNLIADQQRFAIHLLDHVTADANWFSGVVARNQNTAVRALVCEFVLTALASVREQDLMFYWEVFGRLLTSHALVMSNSDAACIDLEQYFGFAAALAALGATETAMVLDKGYLVWAFELLRIPLDESLRKRHRGMDKILKLNPEKLSALYTFIHAILDGHASMSDYGAFQDHNETPGPHLVIDDAVVPLQCLELRWIYSWYRDIAPQEFVWLHLTHAAHHPQFFSKWQDYAPGKLLRLFMHPEKSPSRFRDQIDDAILRHVEREETCLSNLLHLVLNYVSVATPQDALRVFNVLTRTLADWEDQELVAVRFARVAMDICPVACVDNLQPWVVKYLSSDKSNVRAITERFLNDKVFGGEVLTDDPTLNSTRSRSLRYLVRELTDQANDAYRKEEPRGQWESVTRILGVAEKWMIRLHVEGKKELKDGNQAGKVNNMLEVELGELSGQIVRVNEANRFFADWNADDEDDDDVVEIGVGPGLRGGLRSGSASAKLRSDDDDEVTDDEYEEWSDSPVR